MFRLLQAYTTFSFETMISVSSKMSDRQIVEKLIEKGKLPNGITYQDVFEVHREIWPDDTECIEIIVGVKES